MRCASVRAMCGSRNEINTSWQLSLDLNQPAEQRIAHRHAVAKFALELDCLLAPTYYQFGIF